MNREIIVKHIPSDSIEDLWIDSENKNTSISFCTQKYIKGDK